MKKNDLETLIKSNLYLSGFIVSKGLTDEFLKFSDEHPDIFELKRFIQSQSKGVDL